MGPVRRPLLIALVLRGWPPPPPSPPGAAAQPRSTEPVGVYIDRGIIEYDDRKYAEALKNFLEALQIDPENAEVRYFVGIAYLALDQVDQAITHLEKARQLDPADLDIAFKRKEYEKALAYFQENVSSDVRFQQQNRFYTGLTKHHLGRDEEATRDLEEAV